MKSNLPSSLGLATALCLLTLSANAADALTLDEYFNTALKRSEVIAIQSELITQAEERYRQANAGLLPTVNAVGAYTWRERTTADTPSSPNPQRLVRLTATQPLFRGFREFAGLRQTKALINAQTEDYRHAQIQLFRDVSQNFYDVLAIEQDLKNLEEQINQNLERETELKDRVRIGRSRLGETLTVQTTVSTLRAQVEQLRGQLQAAREALAFLSGLESNTPLRDTETLPTRLDPLDEYLTQVPLRPDVKASQQRITAAQENITVAKGAHLPTLDLNANRYLERTGSESDVDWDVQLALTIPLYAGGSTQSRVREAASQRNQAEFSASQTQRLADQEIRSSYQSVLSDQARLDALEKATDAARKNYQAQLRDYRLSLVTNLDVLQALSTYQENQRTLDRARYTAKFNYLTLQTAAMRRPALQPGGR